MAKIDISKIEGYAEMSAEDKVKALEALEYEDNAAELERLKNANSKANSEAAEWKRKHNALLSEDEKKKQEEAEERAKLEKRLAELEKEKTVSDYKSRLIAQGYSADLAADTAKAMADGDTDKVFTNQQKFLEEYAKTVKADALKKTPKPPAGDGGKEMTIDEFRKLSARERFEFAQKNPEEYKTLYGGNE